VASLRTAASATWGFDWSVAWRQNLDELIRAQLPPLLAAGVWAIMKAPSTSRVRSSRDAPWGVVVGIAAKSSFYIDVRAITDDVVVLLTGEFDLTAAPCLHGCLERAIEAAGGAVVVDLEDVTFLDCTGISTLLAANEHLHAQGRALRVTHISAAAARVFEMTGLNDVFPRPVASAEPGAACPAHPWAPGGDSARAFSDVSQPGE
jgi:anti-anti-sigma factor